MTFRTVQDIIDYYKKRGDAEEDRDDDTSRRDAVSKNCTVEQGEQKEDQVVLRESQKSA